MSSRPLIKPFSVITNGDMSGNLISKVTVIDNLSMMSYQINWAGTAPVGVINVQVSNDYSQNGDGSVRVAGNWTNLVLSSTTNVSGATGTGFIDIDALGAYAVRIIYTRTSGTGLMNAFVVAKVS